MKEFFVTKTNVKIYQVFAPSEEQALHMVKSKLLRPVGSKTQEGYSELVFDEKLEEWKVATTESAQTQGEDTK
jgi:hypothetical protein